MNNFKLIFGTKKTIIGVIHLPALAGTPKNELSPEKIINKALAEAIIYQKAGIDAIIIENMHDVPYVNGTIGHEISAIMAIIAHAIKKETALPIGIQILAGCNKEALAAAHASGADFIRAEGYIFSHIADEGFIDAQAGELQRYKRHIGADNITILTDIKKKHSSHALTQDVSLLETAKAAEYFLSDGVIVTGTSTGKSTSISELHELKNQLNIPVLVGSGITVDNIHEYIDLCDAMIVGSYFKEKGYWKNQLSYDRVVQLVDIFQSKIR